MFEIRPCASSIVALLVENPGLFPRYFSITSLPEAELGIWEREIAADRQVVPTVEEQLEEASTIYLDESQLGESLARAATTGRPSEEALEAVLVEAGLVLAERVAACRALALGVPFVDPAAFEIHRKNAERVPAELARRHGLFPLFDLAGKNEQAGNLPPCAAAQQPGHQLRAEADGHLEDGPAARGGQDREEPLSETHDAGPFREFLGHRKGPAFITVSRPET